MTGIPSSSEVAITVVDARVSIQTAPNEPSIYAHSPFLVSSSYDHRLTSISTAAMGWICEYIQPVFSQAMIDVPSAYPIRLAERLSTTFGHADMVAFAFVLQLDKGLHHLLERDLWVDPCHLEKVDLLRPAKRSDDSVQAAAQVLFSARLLSLPCTTDTGITHEPSIMIVPGFVAPCGMGGRS